MFLKKVLHDSSAFKDLKEEDLDHILTRMFKCSTAKGNFVFQQKDPASCVFIIAQGNCEV